MSELSDDQFRALIVVELTIQTTLLAIIAQRELPQENGIADAVQDALAEREHKMNEILRGAP